ncbi:WG repeat-containing protein [Pseudomonas sp. TE3786]
MSSIPTAVLRLALLLGLINSAQAEDFALSCFYSAADRDEGLAEHPHCARLDGDTYRLAPDHLQRLSFDANGLASAAIDGAMFYIKPSGATLKVLTFDNGADYFEEGLTRAWVHGKVGYYDKDFNQVIAPIYDWGTPFADGRAEVCQGCSRGPSDGDGHWAMGGGKWGVIDRSGKLVEPLQGGDTGAVPGVAPKP